MTRARTIEHLARQLRRALLDSQSKAPQWLGSKRAHARTLTRLPRRSLIDGQSKASQCLGCKARVHACCDARSLMANKKLRSGEGLKRALSDTSSHARTLSNTHAHARIYDRTRKLMCVAFQQELWSRVLQQLFAAEPARAGRAAVRPGARVPRVLREARLATTERERRPKTQRSLALVKASARCRRIDVLSVQASAQCRRIDDLSE